MEPYARAREVAWDGYLRSFAAEGRDVPERLDVRVLDEKIILRPQERRVVATHDDPFLEIMVLHYLTNVDEKILTGRLVKYRQLPGGNAYEAAFRKRVEEPIRDEFGVEPRRLVDAAIQLGGTEAAFGDAAVVLAPLPMVPMTIIVWKGDEEIMGDASVLFDSGSADIMHTEDLAAAGSIVAESLLRINRAR
jgi:hypothetical protein